jgi:tRNA (adenine37-N6)-methyltransferase
MELTVRPIGVIHSPYLSKETTPIQGRFASDVVARVEVFPEYAEGLKDLELFSHIWLIYRFHELAKVRLVTLTFLDDEPHGIFACRHPGRPNALGMTVVELVRREGSALVVRGVDALDGTPLVDLKPYLPQFDCVPHAKKGWTEGREERPKPSGRE